MTIDDDIEMLEYIHGDYRGCRTAVALENAISNLRKYQKIEQIANDKNINGDLLRMSEIRWVLEDGKID